MTHDDMELIEHRIYHDYVGTVDFNMRDMDHRIIEDHIVTTRVTYDVVVNL